MREYPSGDNISYGIMTQEFALAMRRLGVDFRVLHVNARIRWPFTLLNRYQVSKNARGVTVDPEWVARCNVTAAPGAVGISLRSLFWRYNAWDVAQGAWGDFKPDIVHARMFIPSAVVGEYFARRWNVPLLISTHGADTRTFINRWPERRSILGLCRRADAVVCVSETVREILRRRGAAGDNIHVIYNGMDEGKIYKGENSVRRRYAGKTIVLGVGNLENIKGFDLLIRAVAELRPRHPELVCLIVGGGREQSNLRELVASLGLAGVVELLGAKPAAEVMEYMDACDIFCLPSWSEGFGIVYLEAMAQGKPVIAVEGQGISDIVREHQVGLLVAPRSVSAVTEAVSRLATDAPLREQMGRRGAELVRTGLSWDACAKNYLDMYQRLISGKEATS